MIIPLHLGIRTAFVFITPNLEAKTVKIYLNLSYSVLQYAKPKDR
jgi:hypothetical protein